jgi:hypothetical protein
VVGGLSIVSSKVDMLTGGELIVGKDGMTTSGWDGQYGAGVWKRRGTQYWSGGQHGMIRRE